MNSGEIGWNLALGLLLLILSIVIGFWLKVKAERRRNEEEKIKIDEEREKLDNEKIEIQKKEEENKEVNMKLEEKGKHVEEMKKGPEEKWPSCSLTEEQMYKAMDVVTKIAEERQVPFYSVLDFIKSESESEGKVSLGTLLSRFNISHTTVSSLCTELQKSELLEVKEDSGNEKIYVLTPLGKEVVERFNAFFCFVIRKNLMMEAA